MVSENIKKNKNATPFLGIGLLWLGLSGDAEAATLIDSVDAARRYDAGYLAAGNARNAGREKREQGIAGWLPQAQIDSGYVRQDQPGATYATATRRHHYSVSITQPIFDQNRTANYERGVAQSDAAEIEFAKAEQKLILEISNAYFDVLFQREALAAAEAAKNAFSEQLKQAQSALKLGEGTRIEVIESQANHDQAVARSIAAANDLEIAQTTYTRLTGLRAAGIEPVQWSCVRPAGQNLGAILVMAQADSLNVRAAKIQVEQAGADVRAAKSGHLPVVTAQAAYGKNWSRGSNENEYDVFFGTTAKTSSRMVGVNVTIPLFAGGAVVSQTREAVSYREQALQLLEDTRRKAREEARTAYLTLTNDEALISAQERALESADNKVKSTRMGRETGLRNTIDVLNALQAYFEAVRDLADTRYKFLKARLQLSAALNTLPTDVAALSCRAEGLSRAQLAKRAEVVRHPVKVRP
ncbi:MAG: TolC family outer membrane protein [Burkholderiaceae bacterium]|jgi:outer membrane protein|nr:TolC family outer membrane protein [Burkholderiaceae bacterium]